MKTGNTITFKDQKISKAIWIITKMLGMGKVNLKMKKSHKYVMNNVDMDLLDVKHTPNQVVELQRISKHNTSESKYKMRPRITLDGVKHL